MSSLTLYDASTRLLSKRFDSSATFQQQGQVSWSDVGKTTVSASLNVLARYSAANVDPYTVLVGQGMAGSFAFGPSGKKRFEQAIIGLLSMRSMGDLVHFGFGINSVVRNLAATEEGGCLVALCAAAVECYPEDQAASIMWELVRLHKASELLKPSALQWKFLIRACAGSLAATSFSNFAEHLMGLNHRQSRADRVDQYSRGCSSPDTIARALLGIGEVSTGKVLSISIVGGSDAGWLVALAEWMFDLRVAISTLQGDLLHTNCESTKDVQVHVFLGDRLTSDTSDEVEVRSKTFYLRDIMEVINIREGITSAPLICGRVPWSSALSDTFGSYFKRLIEMSRSFGTALGCAARVFEAVKKAEGGFHGTPASDCCSYFTSSYGVGYVSFATTRFPELKCVRTHMDRGASKSTEEAARTYEACIVDIGRICGCKLCNAEPSVEAIQGQLCLTIIVETILVVIRSLSGISIAGQLDPLLFGLEASYRHQVQVHAEDSTNGKEVLQQLGTVRFILELNFGTAPDGVVIGHHLQIRRLEQAARIFGRGRIERATHKENSTISAVSAGGISVFLDALLGVSDDPERVGLCHVIAGHISMDGRPFSYLSDLSDYNPEGMDYRSRNNQVGLYECPSLSDLQFRYVQVSLAVAESIDSLQVGILVKDADSSTALIGPGQYTYKFLQCFGLVGCTGSACSIRNGSASENTNDFKIEELDRGSLAAFWHFRGDMIARVVALMRVETVPVTGECLQAIIRTEDCLDCCRNTAVNWGFENAIILSKAHE